MNRSRHPCADPPAWPSRARRRRCAVRVLRRGRPLRFRQASLRATSTRRCCASTSSTGSLPNLADGSVAAQVSAPRTRPQVYEMASGQHDAWAHLGEIACPVTVVPGSLDYAGPARRWLRRPGGRSAFPTAGSRSTTDLGRFGPARGSRPHGRSRSSPSRPGYGRLTAAVPVGVAPPAYCGPMALAAPHQLVPVEGVELHRLRAGLPLLEHRPPARAAVGAGHQGNPRPRRPRAALRPAGPGAHGRRPWPAWPRPSTGCRPTPTSIGLELDAGAAGRLPRRRRATGAQRYFVLEDPTTIQPDRHRATARGHRRRGEPHRHHRPARARRRRRAGGHRLQDRPGPVRALRAGQARGRALLLVPVRAALRFPAGPGATALPVRAGRHHVHPHRAVHPGIAHEGGRVVAGRRTGMRAGRLPPEARSTVLVVQLPGLLPRDRRRSGIRGRPRSSVPSHRSWRCRLVRPAAP